VSAFVMSLKGVLASALVSLIGERVGVGVDNLLGECVCELIGSVL